VPDHHAAVLVKLCQGGLDEDDFLLALSDQFARVVIERQGIEANYQSLSICAQSLERFVIPKSDVQVEDVSYCWVHVGYPADVGGVVMSPAAR